MTIELWGTLRNMPEPDDEEEEETEDEEEPDEAQDEFDALLARYWQKLQEKTL